MTEISWVRRYYWSLRRELWEIPAIFVAPVGAGVLVAIAHAVSVLRGTSTAMSPSILAIGFVMVATFIPAIFYSLDTLYGERKDRSILFWKSLPVSDTTAVAAKVTIPLVIAPLLAFVVTELTLLVMMPFGHREPDFLRTSQLLLYHLFAVHALWWAPFYGWLFLISAWARRTPFVWAVLPVVALSLIERMIFNTSRIAETISQRLNVSPEAIVPKGKFPIDPMTQMTPMRFVGNSGLWIGLGIAALLLAAAVRLRKHHGPI